MRRGPEQSPSEQFSLQVTRKQCIDAAFDSRCFLPVSTTYLSRLLIAELLHNCITSERPVIHHGAEWHLVNLPFNKQLHQNGTFQQLLQTSQFTVQRALIRSLSNKL
jgi:hypothetical protein